MNIRRISLIGAAILIFPVLGSAELPNYKYLEASYVTGEADADGLTDFDQDGIRGDASAAFLDDRLWVFASYTDTDGDEDLFVNIPGVFIGDANIDVDVQSFQAGAGYILALGERMTIDFSARFRQDDVDAETGSGSGFGTDIDGYGAAVGARFNIIDMVEIFGRVGVLSGDYDETATYDLGAVLNIGPAFAITAAYEYVDLGDAINVANDDLEIELTNVRLGARLRF